MPDDLARGVDALCKGAESGGGQRIVERVEDIDWHDTGSSLIVSLAENVDREAGPVFKLSLGLSCTARTARIAWARNRGNDFDAHSVGPASASTSDIIR
jgi:hypothetical protein